jgi:hypothetical protein
MTLGRYVLTADVTVPAGAPSYPSAGPGVTTSGTTSATPGAGTQVTTQTAGPGTFLVSWTAQLQTAAAGGDANNFGLYSATALIATSVNAGTVASYPQAAVATFLEASAAVAVKNIGAGTTGSVYAASLTLTPLMAGDNRGTVNWTGPGSPAQWSPGGFPVLFQAGTPLWLDSAGPLYALLSASLRVWIDGTDNTGHGRWAALAN